MKRVKEGVFDSPVLVHCPNDLLVKQPSLGGQAQQHRGLELPDHLFRVQVEAERVSRGVVTLKRGVQSVTSSSFSPSEKSLLAHRSISAEAPVLWCGAPCLLSFLPAPPAQRYTTALVYKQAR